MATFEGTGKIKIWCDSCFWDAIYALDAIQMETSELYSTGQAVLEIHGDLQHDIKHELDKT